MRVLVIEDDEEMAEAIAAGLRRQQMAVDIRIDGASGLEQAQLNDYDVVVLDRDLPSMHGDDVCAALVAGRARCRILMLTAASSSDDLVDGLHLGADDYLPKPFDFSVLVARIEALARRSQPAHPPILHVGGIEVDTAQRCVRRRGEVLSLTPKEFGTLELLVAADGRTVSAEELLERVWDENADSFTSAVKITISRLRAKLGDPSIIETVAKSGYRVAAR
jgi:DNA-binding response OmpR family regulator